MSCILVDVIPQLFGVIFSIVSVAGDVIHGEGYEEGVFDGDFGDVAVERVLQSSSTSFSHGCHAAVGDGAIGDDERVAHLVPDGVREILHDQFVQIRFEIGHDALFADVDRVLEVGFGDGAVRDGVGGRGGGQAGIGDGGLEGDGGRRRGLGTRGGRRGG